ncbi:coronatine-insensitive protein homolog 1b-like [Miscanthus floridulus]|uniref:coronatine-insensitive protein homolog 1b-like n=1 Tax=Miscanthus floridulus TaxID=154761 RepID=UPI003458339B
MDIQIWPNPKSASGLAQNRRPHFIRHCCVPPPLLAPPPPRAARHRCAPRRPTTAPPDLRAAPARLLAQFPRLGSLAVNGKPHAAMYGLIPDDWGAYARPWVTELAVPLECLKALHLRRMVVTDNDLAELVRARGHMLQELKLDKCTGFSTDGLRLVAHSCRKQQSCCSDLLVWPFGRLYTLILLERSLRPRVPIIPVVRHRVIPPFLHHRLIGYLDED